MGLFDRFMPLQGPSVQELSPPPHLTWASDYGQARVPALTRDTALLLSRYLERKDFPILPENQLLDYTGQWESLRQAFMRFLKYEAQRKETLGFMAAKFFETWDRHAAQYPNEDPFQDLHPDELVGPPQYLYINIRGPSDGHS
jgi:hypothetical protein